MKLSLILPVYNTAHLLARTLETLKLQEMSEWELLIIDDMSLDDVPGTLKRHGKGLPTKYYRLTHNMGMRGNTASLNYGIEHAEGTVVMWSTPEVMLPPGVLPLICGILSSSPFPTWLTVPSHGLSVDMQLSIDMVDWLTDIHSIKILAKKLHPESPESCWFYMNFYQDGRVDGPTRRETGHEFGNNQTVAVVKEEWDALIGKFPLFLDYGTDDPWIAGKRKEVGYRDVTMWDDEAYHQWHPRHQYWMAHGLAPNWNRYGHTTSNLANDPLVPDGGTCEIWDRGEHTKLTVGECIGWRALSSVVRDTGFR